MTVIVIGLAVRVIVFARIDDGGVTADGDDGSKNGYKYKGVIRP